MCDLGYLLPPFLSLPHWIDNWQTPDLPKAANLRRIFSQTASAESSRKGASISGQGSYRHAPVKAAIGDRDAMAYGMVRSQSQHIPVSHWHPPAGTAMGKRQSFGPTRTQPPQLQLQPQPQPQPHLDHVDEMVSEYSPSEFTKQLDDPESNLNQTPLYSSGPVAASAFPTSNNTSALSIGLANFGSNEPPSGQLAPMADPSPCASGAVSMMIERRLPGPRQAAPNHTFSNFSMTSVSASPSRVHSWNAGSAIIASI